MKDKKKNQISINDLVAEHRAKDGNPLSKQIDIASESITGEIVSQDMLNAIFEYNRNITNLDPLYTSIKPVSKTLVRIFLFEPSKTESGLLIPYKQTLPAPTQNGMGTLLEMESPYPYSNKAIVVAIPGYSTAKVGDIVQLESQMVRVAGTGQNAQVVVPYGYMHPDANTFIAPIDSSNRHYGYLLIPTQEISVIL